MGLFGDNDAEEAIKQREENRRYAIQTGLGRIEQAFSGFGPQYYEGVRQATLGQLVPQVERQYRGTRRRLGFGLGDRGLLNSSAAREAGTDLEFDRSLAHLAVGGQANEAVREVQRQVQGQKSTLTSQLVASEDPNMAAQQAVGAAASISAPSITAPLGNLFQTFANTYLANQIGRLYPQTTPITVDRTIGPQPKNYFPRG